MSDDELAIRKLIHRRCEELGLSRATLISRTQLRNTDKAHRRLDSLLRGDLDKTGALIAALPAALELPAETVIAAVEETRQQLIARASEEGDRSEAAYRAAFVPHAILLTEHNAPQPIFVAALVGVEKLLRVDFDLSRPRERFVRQMLAFVSRNPTVACFGRVTEFVINFTPHRAVRYDLDGKALEILSKAVRVGQAELSVRNKQIPGALVQALGADRMN
jgi:hypothetical protein